MPCYDPRNDRNWNDQLQTIVPGHHDAAIARLENRCDTLTKLLCAAGRAHANATEPPPAVLAWWKEHRKHDEATGNPW